MAVPKKSFLSTFTTLNLTVLDGLALSSSDDVTLLHGESMGAVRKHLLVAVIKRWRVLLKCKKFLLGTIVRHIFVEMAIPFVDLSGDAEKSLLVNVFALLVSFGRRKPEADVLPTSLHSSMIQLFQFLASLKTSWNTSSV